MITIRHSHCELSVYCTRLCSRVHSPSLLGRMARCGYSACISYEQCSLGSESTWSMLPSSLTLPVVYLHRICSETSHSVTLQGFHSLIFQIVQNKAHKRKRVIGIADSRNGCLYASGMTTCRPSDSAAILLEAFLPWLRTSTNLRNL